MTARIETFHWEGGIEGHLHLARVIGDRREALIFDRPGDVVATCSGASFPSEAHLAAVAVYGIALASRGIAAVTFVRPIVEKTAKFVATIDPMSIVLYRELGALRARIEGSDADGAELRELVLAEAHRLREAAEAGTVG
ncbi:MAG: hypothetical protein KDC38_16425 [Planctomycetes bacterium]|nr:hypothetical protein [Planctomycetota bacterium]